MACCHEPARQPCAVPQGSRAKAGGGARPHGHPVRPGPAVSCPPALRRRVDNHARHARAGRNGCHGGRRGAEQGSRSDAVGSADFSGRHSGRHRNHHVCLARTAVGRARHARGRPDPRHGPGEVLPRPPDPAPRTHRPDPRLRRPRPPRPHLARHDLRRLSRVRGTAPMGLPARDRTESRPPPRSGESRGVSPSPRAGRSDGAFGRTRDPAPPALPRRGGRRHPAPRIRRTLLSAAPAGAGALPRHA